MTKILSVLTLITVLTTVMAAQGIEFVDMKWQEALAEAKEQNKLLFVDAYAQWCGPCKRMAKHEFTKEAVGDYYNANFVNLKLDMESPNGRTFDSSYPVSAYPTMFFLDGDGKVVRKIKGGQKGDQLISMAKGVVNSYDYSADYKVKYDEGDRSYETVYNYVKTLNQSGKSSLAISNQYLRSEPELTAEQELAFIAEAAVESDSKLFEQLLDQKKATVELLGAAAYDKIIMRACDNTVSKAVEYETQDLLDEAITNANRGLTTCVHKPIHTQQTHRYCHHISGKCNRLQPARRKIYFGWVGGCTKSRTRTRQKPTHRYICELVHTLQTDGQGICHQKSRRLLQRQLHHLQSKHGRPIW